MAINSKRLSVDQRVKRDLCFASVANLISLPINHPAIERSLEHLEKLCAETRSAIAKKASAQ
jgi:hypothetical protein